MSDDRDLILLRETLPARAAPESEALPRTWRLIAERQRAPRTRTRVRLSGRLVPVVAFASVVAVAAAMVWVAAGPSERAPLAYEFAAPPELPPAEAFGELAEAARTATPIRLEPGELLYVRADGAMANLSGRPVIQFYRHEQWLDPAGLLPLRIRRFDGESAQPSIDNRTPDTVADREALATGGPSLGTPTAEWIAGWPTDPDAVLALLREGSRSNRGNWSENYGIWDGVAYFLERADPLIPPEVRTALYTALSRLDRLTAYEITADGRRLYAIRRTERDDIRELLFDATTGRFAGTGSGAPGGRYVTDRQQNVTDIPLQPDVSFRCLVSWATVPDVEHPG
ncbi:hypothetical protein [Plantactinospora sonchi]|uniref:CU044_5270 family protein n=1 Tax=Plantactinospora sonchi TaxID=1544735 RepID=A0ABU7RNT7_9ACTN